MIEITLLGYGLDGVQMLTCNCTGHHSVTRSPGFIAYLSCVERILSSTQSVIFIIIATSLQETTVTSVYTQQTHEEGKHRRSSNPDDDRIFRLNNCCRNQSSEIKKY